MRWPDLSRFGGRLYVGVDAGQPVLVCVGIPPQNALQRWHECPVQPDGNGVWTLAGRLQPTFAEFVSWFPGLAFADVKEQEPSDVVLPRSRYEALTRAPLPAFDLAAVASAISSQFEVDGVEPLLDGVMRRFGIPASIDAAVADFARRHALTARDEFDWTPPTPRKVRGKPVPWADGELDALREAAADQWWSYTRDRNAGRVRLAHLAMRARGWVATQEWLTPAQAMEANLKLDQILASPFGNNPTIHIDRTQYRVARALIEQYGTHRVGWNGGVSDIQAFEEGWAVAVEARRSEEGEVVYHFELNVTSPRVFRDFADPSLLTTGSRGIAIETDAFELNSLNGVGCNAITTFRGQLVVFFSSVSSGAKGVHELKLGRLVPREEWPGGIESEDERRERWGRAEYRATHEGGVVDDSRGARGCHVGVLYRWRGADYVVAEEMLLLPYGASLIEGPYWDFQNAFPEKRAEYPADLFDSTPESSEGWEAFYRDLINEMVGIRLASDVAAQNAQGLKNADAAAAAIKESKRLALHAEAMTDSYRDAFGDAAWHALSVHVWKRLQQARRELGMSDHSPDEDSEPVEEDDDSFVPEEDATSEEVDALPNESEGEAEPPSGAVSDRGVKPAESIQDAGEKIGGARKDRARKAARIDLAAFQDLDEIGRRQIRKSDVWPAPDWRALHTQGVPDRSLMVLSQIYRFLPTAPASLDGAEDYVRLIGGLRDQLETDPEKLNVTWSDLSKHLEMVGLAIGALNESVGYSGSRLLSTTDALNHAFGRRRRNHIGSELFFNTYGALCPSRLKGWHLNEDDLKNWLQRHVLKPQGEDVAERKATEPKRSRNASIESAVQLGWPSGRDGEVSAEALMTRFGFRAVEFGNWVPQVERQALLNMSYDAFATLAAVTGVPDECISFDGRLALSFGARGNGRATGCAHYEPAREVLHLTRFKGVGSMAHEWGHALDDQLGRALIARKQETPSVSWIDDFLSHQVLCRGRITGGRGRKTWGMVSTYGLEPTEVQFAHLMQTLFHRAPLLVEKNDNELRVHDHTLNVRIAGALRSLDVPDEVIAEAVERLSRFAPGEDCREVFEELGHLACRAGQTWPDGLSERLAKNFAQALDDVQASVMRRTDAAAQRSGEVGDATPEMQAEVAQRQFRSMVFAYMEGCEPSLEEDRPSLCRAVVKAARARAERAALDRFPAAQMTVQPGSGTTVTSYSTAAYRLDKRRGTPYWQTQHEMFARAFETWIGDVMEARGWRDDYLVSHVKLDTALTPYPQGYDRSAISARMGEFAILFRERLLHTVRTNASNQDRPLERLTA